MPNFHLSISGLAAAEPAEPQNRQTIHRKRGTAMADIWTKEAVIERLKVINSKGFISVPKGMFRADDGIVGQILEREFGVAENNLHLADLGTYELKGMRKKKGKTSKLTLFHQTSTSGMTPRQIFNRFSYEKPSNRDDSLKRKLFTTIYGNKFNRLGFTLRAQGVSEVCLYHEEEYLATWDLTGGKGKINQVLFVLAETQGPANSEYERFHFIEAYILSSPKNIYDAISSGAVVMELCIDQPANEFGKKAPHDRGPHIRIPVKKLSTLFESVERVL